MTLYDFHIIPTYSILSLFLFLFTVGHLNAFDDAPKLNDPRISTTNPHDAVNSDSCVGQCAFAFVDEMSNQMGDGKSSAGLLNLNYNDFLAAFSNATFFEKFCNLYHTFNYCYTRCPHGYMQELLQRSSEIVDHFCVYNYKAIMEKFGCLSSLDRNVSKLCLKSCTSHHNAVTSLMQNFKQLALNGDSTQAERYLAESCEYVICTLHCDVPTIAHLCDFETAELVISLTKKSFDSMQRMALDTGAVSKWPSMCADIKTYSLPKSPQNPPNFTSGGDDLIAQSPMVSEPQTTENENSSVGESLSRSNRKSAETSSDSAGKVVPAKRGNATDSPPNSVQRISSFGIIFDISVLLFLFSTFVQFTEWRF